ncbi:NADH dehydrogenase (quinone) subunit D [Helicobacter bilis]|uniref:NADH-quinone oxidoreductase subunit D n=1 Tax=Helicobacter bilis TaxID=37372 RepID=A0A4U8U9I4_9HELI|nr:NADH dehydrogenase (quinone) subunit D [Helicobacter bilis]MCI7412011.1 NADH dehydrogenase (quinone) subunit D [Helicobacter bilis]MDD7295996.1 NADH dehydrogenase (quinone) subunit D [Helicobacter bilis]MDY4399014.1 NADH dehydrogenase (quinone) subunit D [Helicobacter bilis]TLE10513.1 NADH dehydrogenase (quinone) subunit D [Helicobacter bilis]
MAQYFNKLQTQFENVVFEQDEGKMVVNLGPQHPSAHGQLRLILELDGEMVKKAYPDIGYLHRGIEKLAENMIYNEFMPTTDRMDYTAASSNNHAFAYGVETLLGVEVPRRAKVIRTIILELNRIISHFLFIATHALDVGAMSVFLYAFKGREYVLDMIEDYCGARLTHNSIRIGGVPLDIPHNWFENIESCLNEVTKTINLIKGLLDKNRIWRMRLEGVGKISKEMAQDYGLSGVMLRGSGIPYDIRKEEPYEIYDELDFSVPYTNSGDCYGRYVLYTEEVFQSCSIIRQAMKLYKDTDTNLMAHAPQYISAPKEDVMTQNYSLMRHFVLVTQGMRPPKGEVYAPTESPKGELGFFISSLGNPYPHRVKIKAPSFYHLQVLEAMLPGHYLADVITIIGNSNIILGEIDR